MCYLNITQILAFDGIQQSFNDIMFTNYVTSLYVSARLYVQFNRPLLCYTIIIQHS